MPGQEMPMEDEGGGDASSLVSDISGKLTELAQMLGSSPAATEQDRSAIAGILSEFHGFVKNNLGQGSGKDAPPAEPAAQTGPTPMEAGTANVQPVL